MQVFKIKQNGFKEIKNKTLIRSSIIMLIATTAGVAISMINTKENTGDINTLPFIIPILAISIGIGLYRGLNRQKIVFESYVLTIAGNLVTREQLNTPTISIYREDIREIVKHRNGSFTIKRKNNEDLINVPAQIENYTQLETSLQSIQPIRIKDSVPFLKRYQNYMGLLTIGLMFCIYTVNNKIIVGLTGTALIALLIWSFITIRRNKNIDNRTRKDVWGIAVVLLATIAIMISKIL